MSNRARKRWLVLQRRRWQQPGVRFAHSGPGGGLVLRESVGWRTIAGVQVVIPGWSLWVYFRRRPTL